MILTRLLMNSVRKHKGLAFIALLYYLYTLGKKMLREDKTVPHSRPASHKR